MKKSSKRFTLTSEAKNQEGFHVRTTGVDLADFKDNPIMLWMHTRPSGGSKDEVLPLGYWDDIEVKDGKITAVPVFDDTDDFAMKIYKKVENGTIKMASAGLRPIEWDTTAEWLEKSVLKEASIVDIGSNREALGVALYNEDDQLVRLADIHLSKSKSNIDMKLIQLSAATVLPLLKLKEGATDAEVHSEILNLVTLSQSQKNEIDKLKGEKKVLQDKIDLTEQEAEEKKCIELADKAVADRKITADQKPFIIKLAEADYDNASKYVETLKGSPKVNEAINQDTGASSELKKLSYDELDKTGKLIKLKETDFETFKEKFKERWGKEYKG